MNWLRSNRITSLDGVPKKSFQECVIANWLILNGIPFVYEQPYEHDTRTLERRQYCPDFWIPSAKIYIEHFGVDEEGNTASYIDKNEYQRGMAWKRDTHRRYGTQLIETYSWEHAKGVLLPKLSEALKRSGCSFAPISPAEALELMNRNGVINQFSGLIDTFLTLYKGNGNRLLNRKVVDSFFGNRREKLFFKLFEPIFEEYQQQNQARSQIDFEDMIAQAAEQVATGQFRSPYRYILIDEFQDISPGRADLVNAIRRNSEQCALFAVGDDWQSIYRFTGSDIGGMTRFHELFGATRQVSLDTTFRFDNMAAEASSKFVLKNQIQIPKQLESVRKSAEPSLIVYRRKSDEAPLDWALSTIAEQSKSTATVLILERYKFQLPQEEEWDRLKWQFPTLQLQSMSIHAAKGLEADYVVMGLRGGAWGFPSQVVDDPLFEMVLTQADEYPNGEERRLFYVAITRAKRKTILVTETGVDMSVFATELLTGREYPIQLLGEETSQLVCKKCGSGTMLLRDGSNGQFYGCSNYPLCSNTEQTCPKCRKGLLIAKSGKSFECHVCGHQARTCPKCKSGVLQQKKGPYGSFWGCSNFKDPDIECRHTEKA
jgi:DNA helicase-4